MLLGGTPENCVRLRDPWPRTARDHDRGLVDDTNAAVPSRPSDAINSELGVHSGTSIGKRPGSGAAMEQIARLAETA
jgi:hypothetical protein